LIPFAAPCPHLPQPVRADDDQEHRALRQHGLDVLPEVDADRHRLDVVKDGARTEADLEEIKEASGEVRAVLATIGDEDLLAARRRLIARAHQHGLRENVVEERVDVLLPVAPAHAQAPHDGREQTLAVAEAWIYLILDRSQSVSVAALEGVGWTGPRQHPI